MSDNADDRASFENGLDQAKEVLTTIGLVVSGIVFAAGVAGLLLVINHVTGTNPPSFGSQLCLIHNNEPTRQ
jgi:ABC-type Fe3+ transport system permease subunit